MGLEPYITEDNFVFDQEKGFYCFQKTGAHNPSCLGDGKGTITKQSFKNHKLKKDTKSLISVEKIHGAEKAPLLTNHQIWVSGRTRAGGGPQFSTELKKELYEFFGPYNRDLFNWIGEDFNWSW